MLTRNELLAARSVKVARVDLAELGAEAHVFVRPLTGKQRGEIEKKWLGQNLEKDPAGFRMELLVRTLCNEAGELLLTAEDGPALMEQPATVIEQMFEASAALSALRKQDVEGIEKN